MEFYLLPPEINSARIYAGPGAAPMLSAAVAWKGIAQELRSAAASHRATISALIDSAWLGPSAAAMSAAAAGQVLWMEATATGAEQTAAAAGAAVAAYQTALAEIVPPELVTANRTRLELLVAGNLLGQNAAAIAATEIEYAQMWAQDIVAMSTYEQASLVTTQLTPFETPRQAGDPGTLADRALKDTKGPDPQKHPIWWLMNSKIVRSLFGSKLYEQQQTPGAFFILMGSIVSIAALTPGQGVPALANPLAEVPALSGLGRLGGVAAGLGQAARLGRISVPPNWLNASEVTRPLASAFGQTPLAGARVSAVTGLPAAPLGELGCDDCDDCQNCSAPKYGFSSLVMARPADSA
ncbi:PPE family protein [Mycobacterium shigaense]|uniref:PPE family protein n=1 Tax=Mycobacterium shigaense TaxID=722731 RepID=UPI0013C36660|nr:PPE family protein [Mycobacterium shigaense]MEA1125042.1 PPE family protein [Mycobacterium shigaense]